MTRSDAKNIAKTKKGLEVYRIIDIDNEEDCRREQEREEGRDEIIKTKET